MVDRGSNSEDFRTVCGVAELIAKIKGYSLEEVWRRNIKILASLERF